MLGHYLSEGVNPDADMDGSDDCWFTYDDSDVSLTTRDCVCQLRDESAYILFYRQEVRGQYYPPDCVHQHCHYSLKTNNGEMMSKYYLTAVKQLHSTEVKIKEETHDSET